MRVCLMTPGCPGSAPRLVKEADALLSAGHDVRVVCAEPTLWPPAIAKAAESRRRWKCEYVGGHPDREKNMFLYTRVRHKVCRKLNWLGRSLMHRGLCRTFPEIERAAMGMPADLFVVHHPTLLPAAFRAARAHQALVGYDVEDFLTSSLERGRSTGCVDAAIERLEDEYVKRCAYVTAASPLIASALQQKYQVPEPFTILNVFPLAQRPFAFRPTQFSGTLRLYWFSQCLGPGRGLEDVVRALALLPTRDVELHLRGNWDDGYEVQLRTIAADAGMSGTQLHSSPLSDPDHMVRLASEYDIGLATEQPVDLNRRLCLTNKIFTYSLAGLAILATSTPAQSEFVSASGAAALSYTAGDVKMLAAKLLVWLEDRSRLDKARRHSWSLGTHKYNWDLEQKTFLDVVSSVGRTTSANPESAQGPVA